jgi:2-polyprenyl-3-methyl-5-hydroxy-6-metoxy-1,4-benzoquinol methylase
VKNYKTTSNVVPLLYLRSDSKECMDDQHVDAGTMRQTHQQLKNINVYTFGYFPTMSAVNYFLARYGNHRKIRILDIGCGDGETLRRIDDFGRTRNFSLELTGIDLNRDVISAAVELTTSKINFFHGDILTNDRNETYDLIINSLTMHHLTNQEIVALMQWMSAHARIGWFISDLHRHWIPYYFIKYFVKFCRFNHLVCHDAPLSVARSFRRTEWIDLLTQAGLNLDFIKISWCPNFRYGIRYEKSL